MADDHRPVTEDELVAWSRAYWRTQPRWRYWWQRCKWWWEFEVVERWDHWRGRYCFHNPRCWPQEKDRP